MKDVLYILILLLSVGCSQQRTQDSLPSWNDTPVRQRIVTYLTREIEKIPVEDRIAVFDMDGTLICERPWGIETVVSIHRFLDLGKTDSLVRQSIEYQYARKLAVNPRDTSVLNHCYVHGENILSNIILKAFDGADCEEYVRYASHCLTTAENADYGMKYTDMFYQPMLELIELLKEKHFRIYVVSASMQGIVWSVCPQELGLDRSHLLGIRHVKDVVFQGNGQVSFRMKPDMVEPVNGYRGKAVNIYDHIGKIPVVAVGNAYSDFGMFRLVSGSRYPHLSLLLHHDDRDREYVYSPCHGNGVNWRDTLRKHDWLQADMSKEFKSVWKKK